MAVATPDPSVENMKRLGYAIVIVIGVYLLGRAVAEPFVIDMANPATYRADWGGPSLIGVLAVHCGPGIVFAGWAVWRLRRLLSRTTG
jgi:hypothetical protein